MEVIGKDAVESDVRVNDEGECKGAVEDGRTAVLGETGSDKGYKGDRKSTLKCPVVRSVCSVGLGERGRVVDGSLDVGCALGAKKKRDEKSNVSTKHSACESILWNSSVKRRHASMIAGPLTLVPPSGQALWCDLSVRTRFDSVGNCVRDVHFLLKTNSRIDEKCIFVHCDVVRSTSCRALLFALTCIVYVHSHS